MDKKRFLDTLRTKLSILPKKTIDDSISFYSEMIDDKIEEGCSEQQAVAQIGSVNLIASQIISESPAMRIVRKPQPSKRRMSGRGICLILLGSPLWITLLIAALAVIISAYAVIWSIDASLWAAFAALVIAPIVGLAAGIIIVAITGSPLAGLALLGLSLVCAGLGILMFFACVATTRGFSLMSAKIAVGIKNFFTKKENK